MEDDRYICYQTADQKTWIVAEKFMHTMETRLRELTEWQAKAICAILNKGR